MVISSNDLLFLLVKYFISDKPVLGSLYSSQGRNMKIYKVMTQKDRAFGGKFNPEKVEEALNGLAKEGWEVTGVVSAEFPSFGGGRQELVIFLAKDV